MGEGGTHFKTGWVGLIIFIAVILVLASNFLATSFYQPQTFSVSVTSFKTQFSYKGQSTGYLSVISKSPDLNSVTERGTSPPNFLFSLVVRNNASTAHQITSFSTINAGFNIVSSNLPSLPATLPAFGGTVSFTLTIQYGSSVPYKGPLTVQVESA